MKYLFLTLISLMSVTAGAVRNYPMGCLDEPQASRLSAGMVLHSNHRLGFIGAIDLSSSTVALSQLGISSRSLLDLPEAAEMFCSAVHDQTTELGACSVFAIASGLESLLAGRNISRAELYLRVKTKGKSSLDSEGCYLREYIPLLQEGVLPWENFASYDALVACLKRRKESNLRLIYSQDYRETIEDFKNYTQKCDMPIPSDFHPRWTKEEYQVRVDDNVPGVVRFLWWFNPIATIGRTVFDDHHSALQHYETRTRHKMEQMPYLRERFNLIRDLFPAASGV